MPTILFIKVPETYSASMGAFVLDPSIPLPVLLEDGVDGFDPASLSRERLLGGMLAVLSRASASGDEHPDADYFRAFVKAASPDLAIQLSSVGAAKARDGAFAEAEDIFLALEGLEPGIQAPVVNRALVARERAAAARRAGREEEADAQEAAAKRLFDRALSMEQSSPEAFFHAARFRYEMADYQEAKRLFDSALALGAEGDMAEEARQLSRAIESRGLMDELFKEAFDFIKMGREAEGLEKIEAFLAGNGELWNAWFVKGWALRRLRRYEEGRQAFERARALCDDEPGAVDILNELSICLSETGELTRAREALESALSIEPDNVKIISNLGALALKGGDEEEARAFFMTALEIDPADAVAARCLASLDGPA